MARKGESRSRRLKDVVAVQIIVVGRVVIHEAGLHLLPAGMVSGMDGHSRRGTRAFRIGRKAWPRELGGGSEPNSADEEQKGPPGEPEHLQPLSHAFHVWSMSASVLRAARACRKS